MQASPPAPNNPTRLTVVGQQSATGAAGRGCVRVHVTQKTGPLFNQSIHEPRPPTHILALKQELKGPHGFDQKPPTVTAPHKEVKSTSTLRSAPPSYQPRHEKDVTTNDPKQ